MAQQALQMWLGNATSPDGDGAEDEATAEDLGRFWTTTAIPVEWVVTLATSICSGDDPRVIRARVNAICWVPPTIKTLVQPHELSDALIRALPVCPALIYPISKHLLSLCHAPASEQDLQALEGLSQLVNVVCQSFVGNSRQVALVIPWVELVFDLQVIDILTDPRSDWGISMQQVVLLYLWHTDERVSELVSRSEILSANTEERVKTIVQRIAAVTRRPESIHILQGVPHWYDSQTYLILFRHLLTLSGDMNLDDMGDVVIRRPLSLLETGATQLQELIRLIRETHHLPRWLAPQLARLVQLFPAQHIAPEVYPLFCELRQVILTRLTEHPPDE